MCVSLANIVLVRGRGRCASEFVQRTRPVANTSNLDKGVKRRRILPPRHGQKLHLAPDGVALNWNSGERRQPGSVLWRQDGPKTGGCHLLKMAFLSAPVHNFRAWMVGKTSPLESACDVASDPFEKYRLMQVLERDNGLPRHRMFPRQDEHVPLLEQQPAVDTLRWLHGVTDECGIDLAIQKHCNEPVGVRFVQIDSKVRDDPGELQEQFHDECGGD